MVKTAASNGAASVAAVKHGGGGGRAYKGVRMRSWGSWVTEIRAPNQKTRIWLGSYSTAEAAARAYDAALLCLKGSAAAADLNFPSRVPFDLPAAAMSPKSIQRLAAAAAANAAGSSAVDGGNDASEASTTNTPACSSSNASPVSSPETSISDGGANDASEAITSTTPVCSSSNASPVSSPETSISDDGDVVVDGAGDADYYGSLADIEAFFQSPKCMEYAMMDPFTAFFSPAPMAVEDECCWEEEGDIALWSFSSLDRSN
ncbi:hypothetical protein GUJ93_ZPchr0012g19996 [Zizania palustris]|uniref:AP2/ERF domain-containing protein n=1 Tax=Zizania palustris TaxID=103762 RepID=A0A8J5WN69_ZIZPA|nr:hypothetical protein GUJ93_ZPchr0012g19996 [Zizania palustris]